MESAASKMNIADKKIRPIKSVISLMVAASTFPANILIENCL